MRNKYKKKQILEKKEEIKKNDKEINKNQQSAFQKLIFKNSSILTNKSIDNFHKIILNNESHKESKINQTLNKNLSSNSFRKEFTNYEIFNKQQNPKNSERKTFNINQHIENKNDKNYQIKKLTKISIRENNKKIASNINNNKDNGNNFPLTKNKSQKFSTIFINSGIIKKERNLFVNRNNNKKYENNPINTNGIKENKYNSNLNDEKSIINDNSKNYQKLNILDNVKNINNYNNISRNRNYTNTCSDFFSNRKNKNINANNNNYSLNEKSNSLSIISEKISFLNSYEDNSNSLQKEEKDTIKDKKKYSSKKKNENLEHKKYFNIIEGEIKEENENIKIDKNSVKSLLKVNSIYKSRRYEDNNNLCKSLSILSPKIIHDKRYFKNINKNNETDINIDKIEGKNNTNTDNISNKDSSNNIINRIKKENYNYILTQKDKSPPNFLNSFRKSNENIKSNNIISKQVIEKDNIEENKINHNQTINVENEFSLKLKKIIKNYPSKNSSLKPENEKESIPLTSKEKKSIKEININNDINDISNNKNEEIITKPLMKKNQSLPLKSFKFLVHQAQHNDLIKDSFNKYYEAKKISNTNSYNNMNESLTLSTETNFSGKLKYNNNALSDILDLSKKDFLKSPMSSITNLCYNNDYFSEEDNNKIKSKLSFKQKLIKSNKSDIFNNLLNCSFDGEKNNYKYNNYFSNKLNKSKNYGNGIINNNIFSTTLNIYKINDNNNDDFSQIKSILTPSIKANYLYKNNIQRNEHLITFNNNINENNYNTNNFKINNNIIPSLVNSENYELELFLHLEKKLLLLINKIDEYNICKNECLEYINYYFENRIDEYIIKLFKNNHNRINIVNYIKMELLCYLLCYDVSYSRHFNQAAILIKSIMNILHNNFLLIIVLAISNASKNTINKNKEITKNEKVIIDELNRIIKNYLTIRIDEENINELYIIQAINNNTNNINNYYKMILDNLYKEYYSIKNIYNNNNKYKFPHCLNNIACSSTDKKIIIILFFFDCYRLLNNYKISDLKKFFDLFLYRINNLNFETETNNFYPSKINQERELLRTKTSFPLTNNSSLKTILNKDKDIALLKKQFKILILPDINKNRYKYSLIFPLNDILIYFNKNNSSYMIRPGLFEFLSEMKELYELILFSNDFFIYEEHIIENIQKEHNYFDYILNRNHGIDNATSFIQNLISLNRNVKNFIIIDSSLNRFKVHKNNTLIIKPFSGDIRNDKNTLSFLSQLLQKIRTDTELIQDIRISINKYKKSFIYSRIAK